MVLVLLRGLRSHSWSPVFAQDHVAFLQRGELALSCILGSKSGSGQRVKKIGL